MEENKDHKNVDPTAKYRAVDPTDDDTTNLKDDGSTDPRSIEEEHLNQQKRPDAHVGATPGQIDERMADAAAQIREDHADEREAEFREADRPAPDGYREP
ncbi:hypothetical protein CDO73_20045 [Saccharibacillus sp. O23]|uniref:hypothetical protein n=1 Tax=Saccharibacillus sp. O23 TaxID=2009338 RepID=UPI000B4E1905|nr:hypothetical protein [Saccharibacillus sp. O23]OWR28174.1 hypothetical protein CDO73_20045 [Saccharibacillus sp. O23]